MSDTDFVLSAAHATERQFFYDTSPVRQGDTILKKVMRRWKKSRSVEMPPGSVRRIVTEQLHERELFLDEVRVQLRQLEVSIDELTDTIRSMQKF